jgi:hypothetical protein
MVTCVDGQNLHSLGQHVRGVVPDQPGPSALAHHELDAAVLAGGSEGREHAVPPHRRLFGEAHGDSLDHGGPGGATRIVAYCTVGERHLDRHFHLQNWDRDSATTAKSGPGL